MVEQAENSVSLKKFQPKTGEKYTLIFGNEVNGVSDEAMQMIDACIEIPQFGTSILLVLWFRQDFFVGFFCEISLR